MTRRETRFARKSNIPRNTVGIFVDGHQLNTCYQWFRTIRLLHGPLLSNAMLGDQRRISRHFKSVHWTYVGLV